jgi:hypothetical protein
VVKTAKSKQQIAEELLVKVREFADAYHASSPENHDKARERYFCALDRFNNFVLHGTPPGGS